jgi:hypothetical protein
MINIFNGFFNRIIDADKHGYFIKNGYVSRPIPEYFNDNIPDITYQPYVYPFAAFLGKKFNCRYIIDIGCGKGKKLSSLQSEFEIIGIDIGINIRECRNNYSFGTWLEYDLDLEKKINLNKDVLKSSVIVCSDVIEHLKNPSYLLSNIKRWMDLAPVCLLTTPERDLVCCPATMGPPENPAHVREWNEAELKRLLEYFGFNVQFIGLTLNNDHDLQKRTIMAVIGNNTKYQLPERSVNEFKVVAIMTAYNEEDIIESSVVRLFRQGICVYVIDNWSTDSTFDILKRLDAKRMLIGYEKYPPEEPSQYFEWEKLLNRVEELSSSIDADWFIHHDVDEIRKSPWYGLSLKEGIYRADKMGFNAIDHTVIVFKPTDNGFSPACSLGDYYKYFEFGKRSGFFTQIKAWKNLGKPVNLSSSGGHEVIFDGRKTFPFKFLLMHYPIRSQGHGEKKIFSDRKPRWSPEERKNGWHIQYEIYEKGCSFIDDSNRLLRYDEDNFNRTFLVEGLSGIGINR